MGNLIDRELLTKKLDEHCNTVCQYPKSIREVMCGGCPLGTAFDVVDEMPSAEPVICSDCILSEWCERYEQVAERRAERRTDD